MKLIQTKSPGLKKRSKDKGEEDELDIAVMEDIKEKSDEISGSLSESSITHSGK